MYAGRRKLTLEERIKIREMLDQNYTVNHMAYILEYSSSSISREIQYNGGKELYNPHLACDYSTIKRNPNTEKILDQKLSRVKETNLDLPLQVEKTPRERVFFNRINDDIRTKIKDFIDKGYSISLMSKMLGISKSTIKGEFRRCGGKQFYDVEKAQKTVTEYNRDLIKGLESRIDSLEMLVNTVIEIIKEKP